MAEPDTEVSATDDYRERLMTLRDQLTAAILVCGENMLPQLSGQLAARLAELHALPPLVAGPKTVRDQLKEARDRKLAENGGAASAPKLPTGGKGRKRGA